MRPAQKPTRFLWRHPRPTWDGACSGPGVYATCPLFLSWNTPSPFPPQPCGPCTNHVTQGDGGVPTICPVLLSVCRQQDGGDLPQSSNMCIPQKVSTPPSWLCVASTSSHIGLGVIECEACQGRQEGGGATMGSSGINT